jgi:hypothetical protein
VQPTVTITNPVDDANITVGSDVTIQATASDSDGSIAGVEFYVNDTLLGTDSTSPYSYMWSNVQVSGYQITARAIDNQQSSGEDSVFVTGGSGITSSGMVLWSGALDAGAATKAVEALFDRERRGIGAPFHGLLLVEGLYRYGRSQAALDFMRRYWGEMLRRGATTFWDNFSLDWRDGKVAGRNTSLCHGWAAGPTYSLGAHVLGVRPQAPGFAEIRIEPEPGYLEWAAGKVPTPHGEVEVRWSRAADVFRIEASIPEGCTASVALPPLPTRADEVKVDGVTVEARAEGPKLVVDIPPGGHEMVRQVT